MRGRREATSTDQHACSGGNRHKASRARATAVVGSVARARIAVERGTVGGAAEAVASKRQNAVGADRALRGAGADSTADGRTGSARVRAESREESDHAGAAGVGR